jgi:ferredoxin-NADP reductase
VLTLSVPFGALALDDYTGSPMVFVSAGIGIPRRDGHLAGEPAR